MNKKEGGVFLILISLLIIILFIVSMFIEKEVISDAKIEPSDYFGDWIDELENVTNDNRTIDIDVVEATENRGYFMNDHQRYVDEEGNWVPLFYGGSYNGEIFSNVYYDENDEIKMRIWKGMNPTDGIIEGFSILKEEDDEYVLYLFVDEDWKEKSQQNINIIWGEDITDKDNLNFKVFDFSNNINGVYVDKVTGNLDWLTQELRVGRLFFGELTLDDVKLSNYEKTFVGLT